MTFKHMINTRSSLHTDLQKLIIRFGVMSRPAIAINEIKKRAAELDIYIDKHFEDLTKLHFIQTKLSWCRLRFYLLWFSH